ncbi:peptidase inhibitor family I36 protein [Spirillospora sp. NPDC029432]|uniref:peptidase inhibitor family I36 protein n=1 Tax=Spirillospora sp. NPDC029432 TaxID=3154599 RepID=UPI003455446D
MSKIRLGLLAGALAAGLTAAAAPAAALAANAPRTTDATCPKGDVCVWSGPNATGVRCNWSGDDPDWQGGDVQCRPHGFRVNTVWNNGHTGDPLNKVEFFHGANYTDVVTDPLPVTAGPIAAGDLSTPSWTRCSTTSPPTARTSRWRSCGGCAP